jgi:hypothetical protein
LSDDSKLEIGVECPVNAMRRIDFRGAKLREVEFRSLDLDDVYLPDNPELMLIGSNYFETIRAVRAAVNGERDKPSLIIEVYFDSLVKWEGPNQRRGIVDKAFLREFGGDECPRRLEEIIQSIAGRA